MKDLAERYGSFELCGTPIHHLTLRDAAAELVAAAAARSSLSVHLCNAYVLSLASRDHGYRSQLTSGDLNLADGAPVVWAGRRLGYRFDGSRPSGTELVIETARRGIGENVGHYLFGAGPGVAADMAARLRRAVPGIRISGVESPPFRPLTDDDLDDIAERVDFEYAPTIVWVGLGTPKQDDVVQRLARRLDCPVVPVGAAFDFLAGAKQRAPSWMRRLGLEWLHRLATEPRRLWRRYLVDNLRFLRCVLRSARPLTVGKNGLTTPVRASRFVRLTRRVARELLPLTVPSVRREDLANLGSSYGGWTVPLGLLDADSVVYSVGLGEDASFDLALIDRVGCTVHVFDPTPRAVEYGRSLAADRPAFEFHPVGVWSRSDELTFYAPQDPVHVSHSVVNLQGTDDGFTARVEPISALLKELGHERLDLLKIDIEGAEHQVLAAMLEDGIHPTVLCVEFDQPVPYSWLWRTVRRLCQVGYRLVHNRSWDWTWIRSERP